MTKKAQSIRLKKPDVDEMLNEDHFTRILELDFDDMIPFVLSNIRKKGLMSGLYVAVNILALVSILTCSIWGFYEGWYTWSGYVIQALLGSLAGSLLIIPIHELLHGLAYLVLGTRGIKFGVSLKQFFFYVTADRFPVSRNELLFLALLPFIVVNVCFLWLAIEWAPQYAILCGFLLFGHNLMCIGDFAISNFALLEKGTLYSYDEVSKKKCYFYRSLDGGL